VVDGALWGVFFHSGQVCSAGTRLLVQQSIYDEFLRELSKRAETVRTGPALDPASDTGPVVSQTQLETVERYVGIGRDEGADILSGGERAVIEGHDRGYFFRPTVLGGVRNDMTVAREEIFGPVLVTMPFDDDDDAVRIANDSVYGLAGGVWSSDNGRAVKVAEQLRTGTVWINDWHMINPRYPFGGYKQSGLGREHGEIGFDEYREIKHIHVDLGGPERARHPWWDITVPAREHPSPPGADAPGSKPAG
jgi:aldehyde dehydrogenase (NAD+)